jgi:hypothetical protein
LHSDAANTNPSKKRKRDSGLERNDDEEEDDIGGEHREHTQHAHERMPAMAEDEDESEGDEDEEDEDGEGADNEEA